ncbi:MAG TPA: hypothetical protein VEP49_04250 [Acidimicrobiia bacterium]|nr:hypothetical protein [Acidimicrobiia bacterium]
MIPNLPVGARRAGMVVVLAIAATPCASHATAEAATSGATVRVVNLTRLGATPTAIQVFDSALAGSAQRPVARLPYGTASKPFRPRADASDAGATTLSFYRPGPPSDRTLLGQWTENLGAGDRVTVLVEPNDGDPRHIPVFTVAEWERGSATPLPAPPQGKALVLGQGFGLPKSAATTFGVQYGIVGRGCLAPAPDDLGNVSYVGATNTVAITIDPGRQRIAAYRTDDRSCRGKPLAAPVTIDPEAGDRMYVLAFGVPHHPLELLALSVAPQ